MRNINEEKRIITEDENGITHIYPDEKFVSEQKKKKETRKPASPFSSRILILSIVSILLLVFLVTNASTGGFVSAVNGKMVAILTKNAIESFSFKIDADTVQSFTAYDNGFAVLSDNAIEFVDVSGTLSSRQQHSYNKPVLVQRNNRFMIFDRYKSSYSLIKNTSLYSQQSINEDIINAAVSSKNNYAIVVKRDNSSKCTLYGFNSVGKLIYQWNCVDGYIADISMNNDGSKVAATVVNAKNAVLCSSVYILDFEYDSEYALFNYDDETVLVTKFLSDRKLQVVTDKRVYLISSKEQKVIYEYDSSNISYASVTDGTYTAIITKSYVKDNSYMLCVFNKFGKLKSSVELSGDVCGIDSSSKSIAVLFKDKTETYSSNGKLVGSVTDLHLCKDIVINGNYLYLLSSDSVKKYAAYGDSVAVYDHNIVNDDEDIYYNEDYEEESL